MQKDFDAWNHKKKYINDNQVDRVFFHPRELWFAHLGLNVGFEQDGRGAEFLRPILVVHKFNNEIFWALPLTRTWKTFPVHGFSRSGERAAAVVGRGIVSASFGRWHTSAVQDRHGTCRWVRHPEPIRRKSDIVRR
jgi:hypothetical protein